MHIKSTKHICEAEQVCEGSSWITCFASILDKANPLSLGTKSRGAKVIDALLDKNYYQTNQMKNSERREERKKRFKSLSSAERKILIGKKLELQGLTAGSGVRGKDQSSYDKKEMMDLILLTRCFQKNKFQ